MILSSMHPKIILKKTMGYVIVLTERALLFRLQDLGRVPANLANRRRTNGPDFYLGHHPTRAKNKICM